MGGVHPGWASFGKADWRERINRAARRGDLSGEGGAAATLKENLHPTVVGTRHVPSSAAVTVHGTKE